MDSSRFHDSPLDPATSTGIYALSNACGLDMDTTKLSSRASLWYHICTVSSLCFLIFILLRQQTLSHLQRNQQSTVPALTTNLSPPLSWRKSTFLSQIWQAWCKASSRPKFYRPFAHSTFATRSQNTIYSGNN